MKEFPLSKAFHWIEPGPVVLLTTPERKERRTIHANGDGTFAVDGRALNLKKKMVKWKDLL